MWDFLNKKCFQLGVCSRFTMYEYGLTLAIIGKNSLLGVTHQSYLCTCANPIMASCLLSSCFSRTDILSLVRTKLSNRRSHTWHTG